MKKIFLVIGLCSCFLGLYLIFFLYNSAYPIDWGGRYLVRRVPGLRYEKLSGIFSKSLNIRHLLWKDPQSHSKTEVISLEAKYPIFPLIPGLHKVQIDQLKIISLLFHLPHQEESIFQLIKNWAQFKNQIVLKNILIKWAHISLPLPWSEWKIKKLSLESLDYRRNEYLVIKNLHFESNFFNLNIEEEIFDLQQLDKTLTGELSRDFLQTHQNIPFELHIQKNLGEAKANFNLYAFDRHLEINQIASDPIKILLTQFMPQEYWKHCKSLSALNLFLTLTEDQIKIEKGSFKNLEGLFMLKEQNIAWKGRHPAAINVEFYQHESSIIDRLRKRGIIFVPWPEQKSFLNLRWSAPSKI